MHDKKRLKVLDEQPVGIADRTTCFDVQASAGVDCQRKSCTHWIGFQQGHNCVLITAKQGPLTLQTISEIYGLTRMRICQIEKRAFDKIKRSVG